MKAAGYELAREHGMMLMLYSFAMHLKCFYFLLPPCMPFDFIFALSYDIHIQMYLLLSEWEIM